MNLQLIYPMFVMVILTFIVGVTLFIRRMRAIKAKQITFQYFKAMSGETPPHDAINAAKHFSNLFEVPILFYAGCITAMVLPVTSSWVLVWAWAFVAARIAHAFVHLGRNSVRPRALSFFFGFFMVIALWIEVVFSVK